MNAAFSGEVDNKILLQTEYQIKAAEFVCKVLFNAYVTKNIYIFQGVVAWVGYYNSQASLQEFLFLKTVVSSECKD